MMKMIVAALVCGLTIGIMLIGFDLYQQKQEAMQCEVLRLDAVDAWQSKYSEILRCVTEEYSVAINNFYTAYDDVWNGLLDQYGTVVMVSPDHINKLIGKNETILESLMVLESIQTRWDKEKFYLQVYPEGHYQAYADMVSLLYFCEAATDEVSADSFLYETTSTGSKVHLLTLELLIEKINEAVDKAEVWNNIYLEKIQ